jgi:hypothetical protein
MSWLVNLRLLSVCKAAIMIEKDEIKRQAREKESLNWRDDVPNGEVLLAHEKVSLPLKPESILKPFSMSSHRCVSRRCRI